MRKPDGPREVVRVVDLVGVYEREVERAMALGRELGECIER